MKFGLRRGDYDLSVSAHQTGNHEVAVEYLVEFIKGFAVDKLIGDLEGYDKRFLLASLDFLFDSVDFILRLDFEHRFHDKH